MDIDKLDRMAFGHAQGDTLSLKPQDIKIKYKGDLANPQDKFDKEGMKWVRSVDFSEPAKVSIGRDGKFYLEDGHHRWFAAKKLGQPLNVEIEKIDGKPIEQILDRQAKSRLDSYKRTSPLEVPPKKFLDANASPEDKAKYVGDGVKTFYRGVSPETGSKSYAQGKGLYFGSSRAIAKEYTGPSGRIVKIGADKLPSNPLRFRNEDDFNGWWSEMSHKDGVRLAEWNKKWPDPAEYVKSLGYDGVKMGSGTRAQYVAYDRPVIGFRDEVVARASGGAVKLPMKTRVESGYSPARGRSDHHCGPDKGWPEGFCAHYKKPNRCEIVAGFIAARGGCSWWRKAGDGGGSDGGPPGRADGGRLVCGGDIPEHQSEAQWRSDPPQGIGEPEPLQRASGGRIPPHYVDQNPTEAQREAGNYKKAHTRIHSLDITIENPKGTWRQGIGKEGVWKVQLPFHYGYLLGSKAKDGDHVDVAIGPHPQSKKVFVIDQHDAETGKYDEVKCVMGCGSESQARSLYLKSFSDGKGKARLGHLTEMDVDSFKDWLKNGDTTKPLKGADHATMPKVDRTRSVRWLSELSADGLVMFLDKSVPRRVVIKGKVIDPAEPLLRHEMAEYKAMKAASAGFEKEHDRKPDDSERKDIYKSAHRDHGTVAEREYVKGVGLDWDAWSRWCAGELSRLEKMKPVNPPLKPDVRPFPHGRGDLEFTG